MFFWSRPSSVDELTTVVLPVPILGYLFTEWAVELRRAAVLLRKVQAGRRQLGGSVGPEMHRQIERT